MTEPVSWPSTPELKNLRVLVVDDNATNRRVLNHYLATECVLCDGGETGDQALALMRSRAATFEPYDLAILDGQMPEMDGFSLARAIKSDPNISRIRLVMLSSFTRDAQAHEHALGENLFTNFLTKPIHKAQLLACLAQPQDPVAYVRRGDFESTRVPAENSETSRKGCRVLIVEDNAVNQKLIAILLAKLRYQTKTAANGREALDLLGKNTFDVVLMDCQMPEMDGYEATARIRKREGPGRHTPIIAMTASAMKDDDKKCLAAGMDDYISKPIQLNRLAEVVGRWSSEDAQASPRMAKV